MGISKEIWARDVADKLFPNNSFMAAGISDDVFVENTKVHLPQSGANPTVERNRAVLPATIVQRTDTITDYDLDEFTSDPTLITDIDAIEVSYDKRQSVLRQHIGQINAKLAEWVAYHWGATALANMVRTTGSNRTAFVSGATGNRKLLQLADILNAKRLLDNMNVPMDGRVMVMPGEMYNDLLNIDKILSAEYNQSGRLPEGVVNRVFGFDIFIRSSVISYTNASTPVRREPGAVDLTTANAGILCFHRDFVRRALGTVKVYSDEDKPEYYGSIFSAMARAGAAKAYSDETGVVAIIEGQ